MKTTFTSFLQLILTTAVFLLLSDSLFASGLNKFPFKKKKETSTESNNYIFLLKCPANNHVAVDLALIILDKYDLTGAGVVRQIVKADSNYQLNLKDIPAGKYYAGIYTFGLKRQYISLVITVSQKTGKRNSNSTRIQLAEAEEYTKENVVIPPEDIKQFAYVKF